MVYDRHNIYKKVNDFNLGANVNRAFYSDDTFKCKHCSIDIAVFNRDVLLAGHVPSKALYREAQTRIKNVKGYRRVFNQIEVRDAPSEYYEDIWITTKIRARIIADANINPNHFKVVTSDNVVYLMGDVIPEQAERVKEIARSCSGAKKVVTMFQYYNLSLKPQYKMA